MTNTEIWEWMQRDLDGDLSHEEQRALFALLEKDTDLQQKYNRLKSVSLQLEQLPPVVPSISIVDSILPNLESAVATPAAKADLNMGVLPTLEVKSKPASPSESRKWKNKTVWFARIGSTAVAACLLIGVMIIGKEANEQVDPGTQGSIVAPPAVEPPAFIGPPAPQPSTNPTPIPEQGEEPPVQEETKQPPKQQKKNQPPSKPVTKAPEPPPAQVSKPVDSVPVMVPPKPVPREPKPPAFPFGLEEKSDDDKRKKSSVKEEGKEKEKQKEDREKKDDDRDDDRDDDDDDDKEMDKKKSSREYGRTSLA